MTGTRVVDNTCLVTAFAAAVPSTSTGLWVSLKGYPHICIAMAYTNATTVTGSAVTLNQAQTVTGTGSKPLAFTTVFVGKNAAATAAAPLIQTAVVSNTFTLDNTNSQSGWYVIEIDGITLDVQNGFNCIQVAMATAVAQTIGVTYLMGTAPRFAGGFDSQMNPLNN